MKKTIVIGLVLAMVFIATGVNAQNHHKKDKGVRKMTPEMKAYINDNIIPVMKVQRMELDKDLTQDEIARLDEIRGELKMMRQQRGEEMKEIRGSEEKPTVEHRKEMREMKNEMHDLMDEVAIIAENHDPTISRLLDEVQPQIEEWKQDLKAMKQKNNPNAKEHSKKKTNHQGKHGKQVMHQNHGKMFGKFMAPNMFLLWDPDGPMPFFDDNAMLEDNLELNVYPNPASDKIQISLQLEEETSIGFSIYNKDGNEVMIFDSENTGSGLYTKTIDVSGLTEGLYIIKVNAGEKSAIGRLIIKH